MSVDVKKRHKELHASLDELLACYITEVEFRKGLAQTSVMELMEWSHKMTLDPTCGDKHGG